MFQLPYFYITFAIKCHAWCNVQTASSFIVIPRHASIGKFYIVPVIGNRWYATAFTNNSNQSPFIVCLKQYILKVFNINRLKKNTLKWYKCKSLSRGLQGFDLIKNLENLEDSFPV